MDLSKKNIINILKKSQNKNFEILNINIFGNEILFDLSTNNPTLQSKKNIENRLLIRNRENKDEINKRLNRKIENLPSDTIYVENDSDLESGVDNLINALNG